MWTSLQDCAKQIIPHCKLQEVNGNDIKIYEVIEIEYDQYKIKMLTKNGITVKDEELILKCDQLLKYNFQIDI